MQTVTRNTFVTVHTEGGLLPSDLLARIVDHQLDGLSPADYGLAANIRLSEEISRAWAACQAAWSRFQQERAALPADDTSATGTTLTRERWLLPLLAALGYGAGDPADRLRFVGTLTADNGGSYPISHAAGRLPVHLVTFRQELDRRSPVETALRRSPHAIMQEFLNRADGYRWGLISNGLRLRLLRDNAALTRQAFVEFDLESMFQGEQYADFGLLWLACHRSRAAGDDPAAFWLERWHQEAAASGARALDSLRAGVERAIVALGVGFLQRRHGQPLNQALLARLRSGQLSRQDYYWQLLRLVYRLIFAFVAEDRDLLHPPETPAAVRRRYADHYGTARLRRIARQTRGDAHTDAYRGLRLVLGWLRDGQPGLGLPGLGGLLFGPAAAPDLDTAELPNSDLYAALRELAYTRDEQVLRPVDYRNLGALELGSVYEALLEMHPTIDLDAGAFGLGVVAGSERKTTGSYYTPTELVESLLDTALEPVIKERLALVASGDGSPLVGATDRSPDVREGDGPPLVGARTVSPSSPASPSSPTPTDRRGEACLAPTGKATDPREQALLSLRIVDPACGSGHFLIGAAQRLAARLASIRSGEDEPTPADLRAALRDVVAHCIYGVDLNPMAVELCKIALWLETLDPGRPLSFLDANIQCGNSLLGATPALLARGVPDEAFDPLTGDDKAVAREWKKTNRAAHADRTAGRLRLFDPDTHAPWQRLGELGTALAELLASADDTLGDVRAKEELYSEYIKGAPYENSRLWADAWCAAFVMEKSARWDYGLTERRFREIERNPHNLAPWMRAEIERLAAQYQFVHWHLAFPHVFKPLSAREIDAEDACGWAGGFDVVLGNPPWEHTELKEQEWFAGRDDAVAAAPGAQRKKLIEQLPQTNPPLWAAYVAAKRDHDVYSHMARGTGRYPLCGRGRINTYALFAELARHLTAPTGRAGIIVPSGIATDDTTKFFFGDVATSGSLASLYDFENRQGIFPGVHRSYKFCLLTLCGNERPGAEAEFAFFLQGVGDLADPEKRFALSPAEIALINPNTRTCPVFRSRRDAALTKSIYRRVPVLIREADGVSGTPEMNPWGITFRQGLFNMTSDSALFRTRAQLEAAGYRLAGNVFASEGQRTLPLYEGKMVHHFGHRWAGWDVVSGESRVVSGGAADRGDEEGARDLSSPEKQDPACLPLPRYWVAEDEVSTRLSTAPSFVVDAFKSGDPRTMRGALWMWIYGYLKRRSRKRAGLCALQRASEMRTPSRDERPASYEALKMEDAAIAPGQIDRQHPLGPAEWRLIKVHGFRNVRATLALLLAHAAPRWLLGFRDITNTTNERTAIFSVMPRVAVGHTCPLAFTKQPADEALLLLTCMDSFAHDYVVRQKVGGTHLTYMYLKQFPVLPPSAYGPAERAYILPRALELTYTAWDLAPFASEVGATHGSPSSSRPGEACLAPTRRPADPLPPFRWDDARRFQLRAELDALFFHLYGLARDDVAYIMDTFPIVKRKDEAAHDGHYRTKEAILAVYDQLAALGGAWERYVSPLAPPPGDDRARHGEETRPSWA